MCILRALVAATEGNPPEADKISLKFVGTSAVRIKTLKSVEEIMNELTYPQKQETKIISTNRSLWRLFYHLNLLLPIHYFHHLPSYPSEYLWAVKFEGAGWEELVGPGVSWSDDVAEGVDPGIE